MSYLFTYSTLEWLIRVVMTLVVIRRRLPAQTALAWLAVIFFIPVVGVVLYLLVGDNRLGRRRITTYRRIDAITRTARRLAAIDAHQARPDVGDAQQPMIRLAERISGNPIVGGNQVELLSDNNLVPRLVRDIDAAQHHVHLLTYIYRPDDTGRAVGEALRRAAKRGVQCRLLVDQVGSRPFLAGRYDDGLRADGVAVHSALPVAPIRRRLARIDLRNHRKLAVIDGRVGYAGSQNIVDANYGHKRAGAWIDLSGRFVGPVVHQLQLTFLSDWAFDANEQLGSPDLFPDLEPVGEVTAQAVPTGPTGDRETFRRVLLAALSSARRRIVLTTPYLIPDEATLLALEMAADRGVQVQIVVPALCDHPLVAAAGRSYYTRLLDADVEIYQFHPGMLHAKTITVDDAFGLLGSANMDIRSFDLNFELAVLLYGPQVTSTLRFAQQRYLSDSAPLARDAWAARPRWRSYLEDAAALFSPLL